LDHATDANVLPPSELTMRQERTVQAIEASRPGVNRKGTHWGQALFVLVAYWGRAAYGGCTTSGFSAARWPICWARMLGWPRSTNYTAVTTGCWCTFPEGAKRRFGILAQSPAELRADR
jgi:hypothetical protein